MKILGKLIVIVLIGYLGFLGYMHFYSGKHQHDMVAVEEQGTILYYTCSMHPSVRVTPENYNKGDTTCPICHMDLIPVFKEEEEDVEESSVSTKETEKVRMIKIKQIEAERAGIASSTVKKLDLYKEIRTVGEVAYDPELVIAQEEYLAVINNFGLSTTNKNSESLLDSAERKLILLGMSPKQIEYLARTKKIDTNLVLPESSMWIYANVYEQDIPWLKIGQKVEVSTESQPGKTYIGYLKAIEPLVQNKTRTLKARIKINNANFNLLPKMYVDVYFHAKLSEQKSVAVPKSAVLDTGERVVVYMDHGKGKYMQKEVKIGPEAFAIISNKKLKYYPVISGLKSGDVVVTKGNFLVDSQSQLGAAASGYGGSLGDDKSMPGMNH